MRSLRIISDKIQDDIIYNLANIGNVPDNYPTSYLTAGYLTQIIAALDKEKISEWQFNSKDKCSELSRRINLTAKLFMDGYMRSFDHAIFSYHSIIVWFDTCYYMLQNFLLNGSTCIEQSQFWNENAAKLFDIIKKSSDIRSMSTVDLARYAKSTSLMQKTGINAIDDDVLIESSLELLYRRNKFGFFCFSAYNQSTLPLSKQFFVLDCLLECRKNIVLEIIVREALAVYNNLCLMARKNPTGHFTFRSAETISYTAECIGDITIGLSALLPFFEELNQRKSSMRMLDELYCKLLSSRIKSKKSALNNTKNYQPLLRNDMATHISESLSSLFADRIILNFSEQSIRYSHHRPLNDWQTLYFCRCMLEVSKRIKRLSKLY